MNLTKNTEYHGYNYSIQSIVINRNETLFSKIDFNPCSKLIKRAANIAALYCITMIISC